MDDSGLYALLMVFGSLMIVFIVLGIICYIIGALGLMKIGQKAGVENAWLAWIPIANMYVLGKIIRNLSIGSYTISNPEVILPVGAAAACVLSFVPVIGWLISIAYAIIALFALYKLYRMYNEKNAVLFLVLSIIIPFLTAFFIFSFRDKTPNYTV